MLENLSINDWLVLNSKLQQKKNQLRKILKDRGVLKREGNNSFDRYSYFSEAQYKLLFTELFAEVGLELKFSELSYQMFEGSEKQSNGRQTTLQFTLMDTETGFYEESVITGEGIDKGDKAGYKAYTGCLKYFLADTFLVATGDDPETESPDVRMNSTKKASPKQVEVLAKRYTGENLNKLLMANNITRLEDLSMRKASELISKIGGNA